MVKRIIANFNGTGAAYYLELGFIPSAVRLVNVEITTNPKIIEWNRAMVSSSSAYGGLLMLGATGIYTKLTTAGVFPYEGGEVLTTTKQTSTTYGAGIYLRADDHNYQADYTYGAVAQGTPINKWTFETGLTGKFNSNGVASGCRIGVGSIVRIKEDSTGLVKEASITALTGTPDFTTSTYVTLSRAIGSGAITFIGGMYQYVPSAIGQKTKAGIYVNDTVVNASGDIVAFEVSLDR